MPRGLDLEARLRSILRSQPGVLRSELDEQGLQTAALCTGGEPYVVTLDDVSVCSPFPPHDSKPGRCGAHFVGLNATRLGWLYKGEPAERVRARHWDELRGELYARVGLAAPKGQA